MQSGELSDSFNGRFAVFLLAHGVNIRNAHGAGDFPVLLARALRIVLHDDGKHHSAGYAVGGIVYRAQGVGHGVGDT